MNNRLCSTDRIGCGSRQTRGARHSGRTLSCALLLSLLPFAASATTAAAPPTISIPAPPSTSGFTFTVGTPITAPIVPTLSSDTISVSINPDITAKTGLSFDPTSGEISGTPTTPKSATYVLMALNAAGKKSTVSIMVTVNALPPTISVASTTFSFLVGAPIEPIVPTIGPSVSSVSSSPDIASTTGLTFNSNTGKISGTPTSVVSTSYTLTALNVSGQMATAQLYIGLNAVVAATAPPAATTAGCEYTLNIADFQSTNSLVTAQHVYAGAKEVMPGPDGFYHVPLTDSNYNPLPFADANTTATVLNGGVVPVGVWEVNRSGTGTFTAGNSGHQNDSGLTGYVSYNVAATLNCALTNIVNVKGADGFEDEADGIDIIGDAGDDQYTLVGNDIFAESSTTTAADLYTATFLPAPPATVPGAPAITGVTTGNGSATIAFNAPASNGGSPITSYTVTSDPAVPSQSGSSSPITLAGLTDGVEYTFVVTATNAIGTGPDSAPSAGEMPSSVPTAPSIGSVQVGDGYVTVSFSPPANTGGLPITGYTVTSSPDGITGTGTTSPIVVTGLTDGQPYTFTVTSTNADGASPPSAASISATPIGVPSALSAASISVTVGDSYASVSFSPPVSDGGLTIGFYTLTLSPGGATMVGVSSPIVLSNLTDGQSYTVTLTATNSVGTSTASGPSEPFTPNGAPGAPTIISVAPSNASATVTFDAPSSNGGLSIDSYTVTSSPGSFSATGSSSPITVTGLANGQAYTFTVVATNDDGPGLASTPSTPVSTSACLGPTPVVCSASDQCHVAGTCNPVSGVCSNPTVTDGTSCSDGNLCYGAESCQLGVCTGSDPVVCAASDQCHSAGTCDPSSGACSNPTATDGTSCNDGNACTQTDSCLEGTCTGSDPVVCAASDQCHSVGTCDPSSGVCSNPELVNGTTCNDGNACTSGDVCTGGSCAGTPVLCNSPGICQAGGACNSDGSCSYTTASDGTACAGGGVCETGACINAPGAPLVTGVTACNSTVTVSFDAPTSGGSPASYTVTSSPGGIIGTGSSSPVEVNGLTGGVTYTFTVVATNAAGPGPASAPSASVVPTAPYTLPSGAVSWYKGEDNYIDTLGRNNGTQVGTAGFTEGEVGNAFSFTANEADYVSATTTGFPMGAADRTAEGWVSFAPGYISTQSGTPGFYQSVFAYGGLVNGVPTGGTEFGVALQGGYLLIDEEYSAVEDPTPLQAGEIYHFAAVYSSGTLSLYVNGALVASQPVTLSTTAGPLTIGLTPDASVFYGTSADKGFVDELTFYDRALAPSEIQGIYTAGPWGKVQSGACETSPTCASGLTACGLSCTNTATDGDNCGACGNVCPGGDSCVGGVCAAGCASGTQDGNCSVSATTSGGDSGSCASGYTGSCSYSCSNGTWSEQTDACVLITVPGAPTITGASAGSTATAVAFNPPASNGGSAITSYTATSTPGDLTATGSSSPLTVGGLTNGTSYTFTVHATNALGNGPESLASAAVTPESTTQQVNLSSAFTNDGYVIDYQAIPGPGFDGYGNGLSATQLELASSWPSGTVGVANGVTFAMDFPTTTDIPNTVWCKGQTLTLPSGNFGLLSFLAVDAGVSSAGQTVSFTVTYTDGTTTSLTQTVGDTGLNNSNKGESLAAQSICVDPQAGGSPYNCYLLLYEYQIILNPAKTVTSITLPSTTGAGFKGAVNVFAMTLVGSAPAAPPSPPTISAVTPGNASATVTVAAGNSGGSPLGYTVTSSPGGFTASGVSPLTVTGLTNGKPYTFTATASNALGTSTASSPGGGSSSESFYLTNKPQAGSGTCALPVADILKQQGNVTAVIQANGAVSVTFATVGGVPNATYDGANTCECFLGEYTTDATGYGAGTFTDICGSDPNGWDAQQIVPGSLFNSPSIYTNTSQQTGTFTLPTWGVTGITPSGPPDAPTITSVTPGNGEVTLVVTPGGSEGSSISICTATATGGSGTFSAVAAPGSPIVVTGLTNGQAYTFVATCSNANGPGARSAAYGPVGG